MFKLFKTIYQMTGEHKTKIQISFVLQFLETFLSFVPLGATLYFFEGYLNNTLTNNTPLIVLLMLVVGIICRIFVRYYMDKTQFSTIYSMFYSERIKVADHLKGVNMGYFTDDNIGNITTTLVNGLSFIEEQCMNSLITVFAGVVNIILIFFMLLFMNVTLGIIFLVSIVIVLLLMIPYNILSSKISKDHNIANEKLTSAVIEYVKNISVIKSFMLVNKHKRINDAFSNRRKNDLKSEVINIPFIIGSMIIMSIGVYCLIYYALKTSNETMLYNTVLLVIFSLYVYRTLEVIVLKLGIINISNDSFENINNLYAQKQLEVNGNQTINSYDIEFKDVKFAYEEKNIIDGISFKLKENSMNALVGLSGSGKTTLVNLIPRFFDINSGSIKIGGVDTKNVSQETLNKCISMVFQNVYLFKDTIYNNIAFGNNEASHDDVIEACKKARCYDFISNLENGFDTQVGEGGLSLSGGERQRISIARAILKNAPIILLDEATASIDPDNEYEIQQAINELVKDKTILVIAHKLSCVKNADQILVIQDGKLNDSGTHDELLKKDGLYSKLWDKRCHSKSWKVSN